MKSTHILRGGEKLEDSAALGENLWAGVSVDQHGLEDVCEDGGHLDQGLAGGGNTGNVDQNVQRDGDNLHRQNIENSDKTERPYLPLCEVLICCSETAGRPADPRESWSRPPPQST